MTLAEGIEKLRRESIADALPRIADYLEKQPSADLFAMSEAEVLAFLEVVIREYRVSHARLSEAPF